jgi:hypothetical protein
LGHNRFEVFVQTVDRPVRSDLSQPLDAVLSAGNLEDECAHPSSNLDGGGTYSTSRSENENALALEGLYVCVLELIYVYANIGH